MTHQDVAAKPSFQDVLVESDHLTLTWAGGVRDRLPALWLRDNCPSGGTKHDALRSFSLADAPENLVIASAWIDDEGILCVRFSVGHESRFEAAWLAERRPVRAPLMPVSLWDASLQDRWQWHDHAAIQEGNAAHLALLQSVQRLGFALVRGVPDSRDATEALLNRLGFVQENDFGRLFDIVSEPDIWELSQSDLALHVHTDDPYRHTPPGVSLLHCVETAAGGGGVSHLVDGFAVAEAFRADDPEGFRLLSEVAVPYDRVRLDPVPQGDDALLMTEAPILSVNRDGELMGIRFHERCIAPLNLSEDLMDRYYPALQRFTKLIYSPTFRIQRQLQPGEAVIYDNQRVLHGRSAFDGSAGRRHMRLTQTARDQFHSKLRLLMTRHGVTGAQNRLPTGAGF